MRFSTYNMTSGHESWMHTKLCSKVSEQRNSTIEKPFYPSIGLEIFFLRHEVLTDIDLNIYVIFAWLFCCVVTEAYSSQWLKSLVLSTPQRFPPFHGQIYNCLFDFFSSALIKIALSYLLICFSTLFFMSLHVFYFSLDGCVTMWPQVAQRDSCSWGFRLH